MKKFQRLKTEENDSSKFQNKTKTLTKLYFSDDTSAVQNEESIRIVFLIVIVIVFAITTVALSSVIIYLFCYDTQNFVFRYLFYE